MEKKDFVEQINNICKEMKEDFFIIAQCTNKLLVRSCKDQVDWNDIFEHGLDIRIFSGDREDRFFRGTIANEFYYRKLDDVYKTVVPDVDYFDELQFLDIDEAATQKLNKAGTVQAIGGGRYQLPVEKLHNAKIRIRNYLSYEDKTGRAYVSDWRCVEFLEGGELI